MTGLASESLCGPLGTSQRLLSPHKGFSFKHKALMMDGHATEKQNQSTTQAEVSFAR